VQHLLKKYQKRLPNLSEKNRSLFLPKTTERQFIDIHKFDFLNNKPAFSIIQQLIERQNKIVLSKDLDSRDKDANQVGKVLKQILRTDKLIREERGAKDLLLGYPFIEGKTQDDKCIRCPLIFFPITLWKESGKWLLKLRKTEDIKFNRTFLLAYSQFNQVELDENLLEKNLSELPEGSQEFRNQLYQILKNSSLEINFNQINFEDRLVPFFSFTKADFALLHQTGKLKLMPQAVLGVFARSDSFLAPDYEFLVNKTEITSLESLFQNPDSQSYNTDLSKKKFQVLEKQMILPYPIDASQENVLKTVKTGKSIVVQGAPGTGKSQLICNLIADAIAHQKRILLVCQKRVALDIVYQRLAEKKLTEFTALVHDFRNDRKKIYEQIAKQIEGVREQIKASFQVQIYQLEERFLVLSREIDHCLYELENLRYALFDYSECGLPIKELYLTSDPNAPYLDFTNIYQFLDFSKIQDFRKRLQNYFLYQEKIGHKKYIWKYRKSFAQRNFQDFQKLKKLLLEFPQFKTQIEEKSETLIGKKINFEEAESILNQKNKIALWLGFMESEPALQYFRKVIQFSDTDYYLLLQIEKNTLACFENEGIESSLTLGKLDDFLAYLTEYQEAQKNFWTRKHWELFSKHKMKVKALFEINGLDFKVLNIDILLKKITNRKKLEKLRKTILTINWLTPNQGYDKAIQAIDNLYQIQNSLEKHQFQTWFRHHRSALKAKKLWEDGISNILEKVILKNFTYRRLSRLLFRASFFLKNFVEQKSQYHYYLRETQFKTLWNNPEKAKILATVLEHDFELLCESDKLKDSFSEIEVQVINILKKYNFDFTAEQQLNSFENSLRLAWITHIEQKFPVLRASSSLKINQLETQLKAAIQEKRQISEEITKIRSRETQLKTLTFNRLGNLVDYRDLYHQVNKKRNIWALRKLITHFSEEIFHLIPCWMASPESISAIFQPQKYFDLVIFDEASQCYAEKGIPVFYRGKQTIIIGDTQQLQPLSLYTPKWEEETKENSPETEVESVLDLGNFYLPSVNLRGHYRSQSLDLIDFSNQHFYKNKLTLIPDYQNFIDQKPSIEFLKIDGIWEKNTNLEEALAVVTLVQKLLQKGEIDIGIITFNFPQQMLILDVIEQRKVALPKNFFIKNIENVQGDEREIIIFSIGYAPSITGKFRMNFGLLSQERGENRLNVAVTRAKQKIYVVSSIFPHQIRTEDLKQEGAKLLQKYLQYALDVSRKRYKPTLPILKKYYFSKFLKDELRNYFNKSQNDFVLEETLPFTDLVLRKKTTKDNQKNRELKLILTDDNLFYEALSAKENHAYFPELLKNKNWTYLRIYSREFWQNRQKVLQKIIDFAQS